MKSSLLSLACINLPKSVKKQETEAVARSALPILAVARQNLCFMIENGLSSSEIAAKADISPTTVRRILKEVDLKTVKRHGPRAKPRVCVDCGEKDEANGKIIWYSRCRACHKIKNKKRYRLLKLQAVNYKGGCCHLCLYNKCPAAIHFHHKDASLKSKEWKLIKNRTFEQQKSELDKCELVCANCHAELHFDASIL
jgi:DNA-binding CsgD family transcriptional regulator